MPGIGYDYLYPLIARVDQEGSYMKVMFRCPVNGELVEARGPLRKADNLAQRASAGARRRVAWSVRSAVASAAYGAMGGGAAGRLASGAARGAVADAGTATSYTESEKKASIVEAFESVATRFVWDAHAHRFISFKAAGEVMPAFMQQLNSFPVESPYDRRVCARVLTEIACADGHLGEEERAFLACFATPDLGNVDELAQLAPLSPAELAETSNTLSRDTVVMLAWALALTDEEVAPEERARLAEIAEGFRIRESRARQLEEFARHYVVDQALRAAYAGGQLDPDARAAVAQRAQRIGVSHEELERAETRFRKRYGLT